MEKNLEVKAKPLDTTLKYQHLIDFYEIKSPCPNKCKPLSCVAYRFVDSHIITVNDFLPTELDSAPALYTRTKPLNDNNKCMRCAISLFDSAEHAYTKLIYLSSTLQEKYAHKRIAIGMIDVEDGIGSEPNNTGHFSFYEYKSSNIFSKFEAFNRAI